MTDAQTTSERNWRSDLHQHLSTLALNDEQQVELAIYINDHERKLQEKMTALSAEYERVVQNDGEDAASAWLQQVSQEMDSKDRHEMNGLLARLGIKYSIEIDTNPSFPQWF